MASIDRAFADNWVESVKEELRHLATEDLCTIRDFACTALAAVIAESEAVFFQIGDGAIVVGECAEHDIYKPIFMPQHGEFANTTNFITQDNTVEVMTFAKSQARYDEVAIFTDGIERLALNLAERSAHGPFFRPFFGWLRQLSESDDTASPVIEQYLASEAVCNRTDDDKTLILATRRVCAGR